MIITIGAMNDKRFDAVLEYIAPKGTSENGAVFFQMKARLIIPEGVTLRAGYSANGDPSPCQCLRYLSEEIKCKISFRLLDGLNLSQSTNLTFSIWKISV